jgi:hypothetical protein
VWGFGEFRSVRSEHGVYSWNRGSGVRVIANANANARGGLVGRDEMKFAGEAECEAVDADRADRRSARTACGGSSVD